MMEMYSAHSLPSSAANILSPLCFNSKAYGRYDVSFEGLNNLLPKKAKIIKISIRQQRSLAAIIVSASGAAGTIATDEAAERWLLEPVGDGDSRHIGFEVSMPGAFEIASSVVTVGRLPEKADLVIPVATVSGVHARIQKKGPYLLVTDLDSTNGTFVDDRRLRPRVAVKILPGSRVTFGDIHLAMFRVSKLQKIEASIKSAESGDKRESEAAKPSEESKATSGSIEPSDSAKATS